jgi:hypothetical protein
MDKPQTQKTLEVSGRSLFGIISPMNQSTTALMPVASLNLHCLHGAILSNQLELRRLYRRAEDF